MSYDTLSRSVLLKKSYSTCSKAHVHKAVRDDRNHTVHQRMSDSLPVEVFVAVVVRVYRHSCVS